MFRALGWFFLVLGFLALGADAYWSWKAQGWAFEPIGYYLGRADAVWLSEIRSAALRASPKLLSALERFIAWPVWGPAFVLGVLCVTLGASAGRLRPERIAARRSAWPDSRRRR